MRRRWRCTVAAHLGWHLMLSVGSTGRSRHGMGAGGQRLPLPPTHHRTLPRPPPPRPPPPPTHTPTHPPTQPPNHPPTHPTTHQPTNPPTHPASRPQKPSLINNVLPVILVFFLALLIFACGGWLLLCMLWCHAGVLARAAPGLPGSSACPLCPPPPSHVAARCGAAAPRQQSRCGDAAALWHRDSSLAAAPLRCRSESCGGVRRTSWRQRAPRLTSQAGASPCTLCDPRLACPCWHRRCVRPPWRWPPLFNLLDQ